MDGVKQQIQARQLEAMENKHLYETRKRKRELRAELDALADKSKATITQVKKDYNSKFEKEQQELETKLIKIRSKNNDLIKGENKRFEQLVQEIKLNHDAKITELKISQEKEVEQKEIEHKDYLETVRNKFESEKAKLES